MCLSLAHAPLWILLGRLQSVLVGLGLLSIVWRDGGGLRLRHRARGCAVW